MVCIGPGPGPKNVLAVRVEDGVRRVFAYATWKHKVGNRGRGKYVVYAVANNEESGGSRVDSVVGIIQVRVSTTSNGRQKYDVDCSDGITRTVWESNLANALNAFSGTNQQVTIRWSEKQNGQYTNRTIHAFAPPGQALPADTGGGGGGQGGGFRRGGGGMSPDDKTRIAKMGAQGVAATLVAALFSGAGPEAFAEAVELHGQLTKELYKSARSHEKPETAVLQTGTGGQVLPAGGGGAAVLPAAGQPVTATDVAASVPGVQVGVAAQQDATAEAPQTTPTDDIDWS